MRTLTQPLNMSPGGIPPVIHVSQYDSDFAIVFTLFSTVGDFTIESGTTAMARGTKSSGTGYSADATINISAKTVTVTGNAQMTAAAGQNVFEITLLKGGKEISSKNFILLCERAALDADTITDESVLKELNAIIEGAETATQAAEEAEAAADRAEAAAQTLVIDPTLTLPGQPADAKATGDAIAGLEDDIAQIVPGLSEDAKTALLACFRHVAWIDEHGKDYYDALVAALAGVDTRLVYEITPNTDISDWSIDTQQHAFTLDEDFTILIKATMNSSDVGMFLLDSQSATAPIVGARIQANVSDGTFTVRSTFNGGTGTAGGAGGSTSETFSAGSEHSLIFVMKNDNKTVSIKTYVDGGLEYQDTQTLQNKEGVYPSTYYIGKNHSDAVRPWNGTVDLYRIYNVALSDNEIANILNYVDTRIVYEVAPNTDISTWSIDTQQHAFTLDEDFTILANVTTNTAGAEATGMFLLDSQSATTPSVGARIQANISDGNISFRNGFNGGSGSAGGAGGATTGSYSASTNHNIIFILRNASKALTVMTYVDGVLDYQSTDALAEKQNTYPPTYYIGKNHSDVVRPWFGNVNMFRIYNTALSNAEIGNLLSVTI